MDLEAASSPRAMIKGILDIRRIQENDEKKTIEKYKKSLPKTNATKINLQHTDENQALSVQLNIKHIENMQDTINDFEYDPGTISNSRNARASLGAKTFKEIAPEQMKSQIEAKMNSTGFKSSRVGLPTISKRK